MVIMPCRRPTCGVARRLWWEKGLNSNGHLVDGFPRVLLPQIGRPYTSIVPCIYAPSQSSLQEHSRALTKKMTFMLTCFKRIFFFLQSLHSKGIVEHFYSHSLLDSGTGSTENLFNGDDFLESSLIVFFLSF